TRGKPAVRVGVIHPIESYWLSWGPVEQNRLENEERERQFKDLTQWMCYSLVDFDFISEGLLAGEAASAAGSPKRKFIMREMQYDAVIVPGMRTIRTATLKRLEQFNKSGGTVV